MTHFVKRYATQFYFWNKPILTPLLISGGMYLCSDEICDKEGSVEMAINHIAEVFLDFP